MPSFVYHKSTPRDHLTVSQSHGTMETRRYRRVRVSLTLRENEKDLEQLYSGVSDQAAKNGAPVEHPSVRSRAQKLRRILSKTQRRLNLNRHLSRSVDSALRTDVHEATFRQTRAIQTRPETWWSAPNTPRFWRVPEP